MYLDLNSMSCCFHQEYDASCCEEPGLKTRHESKNNNTKARISQVGLSWMLVFKQKPDQPKKDVDLVLHVSAVINK